MASSHPFCFFEGCSTIQSAGSEIGFRYNIARFAWEGFVKKHMAASLLLLTLVSCSSTVQLTPAVTAIPTPIVIVTPTLAPLSPGETSGGQPDSAWNGIPIMPGAIAGEGDEENYVFTIKATPGQVQEYYQRELGKLGWRLQPFVQEESDSSMMLFLMDGTSATLTVSILAKEDDVLVLLVK